MKNPSNKVSYELWYTSTNDKSLDFIKNFKEEHYNFGSNVNFRPRIVTWSCIQCETDFKKKECVSNGRYCAMNHKSTYIQGKDIIMEDLREICLHQILLKENNEQQWWEYMKYVHRMCYEEVNEDCSKMAHKQFNLNYTATEECVKKSFDGANFQKDDNSLLKAETADW